MATKEQKSDKVDKTEENIATCKGHCGTCPTHETCGEGEFLFCSVGDSFNSDTIQKQGCNCPECEVWMNYGLSSMYFCVNGEA